MSLSLNLTRTQQGYKKALIRIMQGFAWLVDIYNSDHKARKRLVQRYNSKSVSRRFLLGI
jgi:hypothetical protein